MRGADETQGHYSTSCGFLGMDMQVTLEVAPGTGDGLVRLLREMAERLCVNLGTLLHGVPVTVSSQHPSVTGWPHRVRLLAHRPNRLRL